MSQTLSIPLPTAEAAFDVPIELYDPAAHPILDANGYWVALTFLRLLCLTRSKVLLHVGAADELGERIVRTLLDLPDDVGTVPLRETATRWLKAMERRPSAEHADVLRAEREIKRMHSLSDEQAAIVRAVVVVHSHARCSALLKHGTAPTNSELDTLRILAAVTRATVPQTAALMATGRLPFNVGGDGPFERAPSGSVWELYQNEGLDVEGFRSRRIRPLDSTTLTLEDFPHLANEIACAVAMLANDAAGKVGVNILLHGPPGHGKTELARLLAQAAGRQPVEWTESIDLADITRYRKSNLGLLVIDEADNLLRPLSQEFAYARQKLELNRLVESPGGPCIWILNDLQGMEASLLRRFDLILEPSSPDYTVERRLLRRVFEGDSTFDNLPLGEADSPALLERYARIASMSGPVDDLERRSRFMAILEQYRHACRNSTLRGRGSRRRTASPTFVEAPRFDVAQVATSADLGGLLRADACPGRLLLHGPPGTGKTAFAHALAKAQNIPLVLKTPSDILSRYVGETESKLSDAFAEARARGALLFFDELDGLLFSRANAQRGWEVTQVNELLLQIDRHDGWLVAATNAMDRVDPAALRRFDLKIGFRAPGPAQREALVRALLDELGVVTGTVDLSAVRRLEGLVPGDVACIRRRLRYESEPPTAGSVISLLEDELVQQGRKSSGVAFGFSGDRMQAPQGPH